MDRAEQTLMRIGRGYQLSQALYVAAKLGVADALAAGPRSGAAIGRDTMAAEGSGGPIREGDKTQ